MKDMNIAKLSSVDVPLFNGIVSDLFPGIESPVIDYSKVSDAMAMFCGRHSILWDRHGYGLWPSWFVAIIV